MPIIIFCAQSILLFPKDRGRNMTWYIKVDLENYKLHQPVQYGLLKELHSVPVRLWFKTCLIMITDTVTELFYTLHTQERSTRSDSLHTFEQAVTAVLQQTVDVQRDEELGSQWISIQVRCQCKRNLQHWDQQEAAGGRFSVPPLNLMDSIRSVLNVTSH